MKLTLGQVGAWLLLILIGAVTLSPLEWRPGTGFSPQLERFAAFAVIGLVFSLAYPRRRWVVALTVFGAALAFEAMQLLVETRHAGIRDVLAKLAGGACGLLAGWAVSLVRRRNSATDGSG